MLCWCYDCSLCPDFGNIPKLQLQVLYGCTVGMYNDCHPKFKIKYLNSTEQVEMVNLVTQRLNLINGFDVGLEFSFEIDKCSQKSDPGWTVFPLKQLNEHREAFPIEIPKLREDHKDALMQLGIKTICSCYSESCDFLAYSNGTI